MNLQTRTFFGRQFSESDASGDTTKDIYSTSGTDAQGQNQSPVKPVGSAAARFQIRSANALQYLPARHEDNTQTAGERSKEGLNRFYESNKSKSLDWRGVGTRTGHRNTTEVTSGTRNFGQTFLRRSESLDRNEPNNTVTSYTEDNQPNSVPWRFQGSSITGQGDRKDYPNSESTPGTMNRMTLAMEQTGGGQSLPVRLKSRRSIGDDSSPWAQEQQGETSPDQPDNKRGIWAREQGHTSTEEVTGNQTIMERIEKLFGTSLAETKSDANSKDEKRNCTSDSILRPRKTSTESPSGPLSPSDSQQMRPSYSVEKAGTFPRWFSKNEQTFFDKMQEPSTPEIRDDQRDASCGEFLSKPTNMETSAHKKFQSFSPADEETSKKRSSGFFGRPLERTRSNLSDIAQPSGQRTHAQSTVLEASSNISNRSFKHLPTTSGGIKKENEKEEPTEPKYPQALRGAAHSEMQQEDEERSCTPSTDSVKNTIHKFEAMAQQNQSAPHMIRARRALSVPEQPKPVVHVKKSDSDLNLKFRRGNTESIGTNLIYEVDRAGTEPTGYLDLNKIPQSNPSFQVKPTSEQRMKMYKTSIDIIPTFPQLNEPAPDQHYTWDDKRRTVRNRYIDEPDLAIIPRSGLSNTGTMEKKSRNPTFQPTVSQQSSVNRLIKQQSIHVNMDDDKDDGDDDDTPTNSPDRDPLTVNLQGQSKTVKPQTSTHTSYTDVFTTGKSGANGTHPKAVANPSASLGPVQGRYSSLNNSNNNNYNTTRNDPGINMARWSSDEEDYDDDDDYEGTDSDSDSGESSVTITSNMSQSERRSFSLRYAL